MTVRIWNKVTHKEKTLMELECYLCPDATKNRDDLDMPDVILIPKQKACRMSWSSYKFGIWNPTTSTHRWLFQLDRSKIFAVAHESWSNYFVSPLPITNRPRCYSVQAVWCAQKYFRGPAAPMRNSSSTVNKLPQTLGMWRCGLPCFVPKNWMFFAGLWFRHGKIRGKTNKKTTNAKDCEATNPDHLFVSLLSGISELQSFLLSFNETLQNVEMPPVLTRVSWVVWSIRLAI